MLNTILQIAFGVLLSTFFVGIMVYRNRSWVEKISRVRDDAKAVQSSYIGNPLRLGGFSIVVTLSIALAIFGSDTHQSETIILLTSLPVFMSGLLEDLGYRIKPIWRLICAFISASLAAYLLGYWIDNVEIIFIDDMLAYAGLAIFLTILYSAIYCHSLNLVDGLNGFAAQIILYSLLGLAFVSFSYGDKQGVFAVCIILAAAISGFFLNNWPQARLFLGDAGSYFFGHVIVWMMISTAQIDDRISYAGLALILFWPNADMLHTVARRTFKRQSLFAPDNEHIHHKMRFLLEGILSNNIGKNAANSIASVIFLPFLIFPVVAGVFLIEKPDTAWIVFFGLIGLFSVFHFMLDEMYNIQMAQKIANKPSIDSKIIQSKYSGPHFEDCLAVYVNIFSPNNGKNWRIETNDGENAPVIWSKEFSSDIEAWNAFAAVVKKESMESVSGPYQVKNR